MTIEQIRRTFRTPRAEDYPELRGCSRERIYEGKMGPGGLYLAAQIARRLDLRPTDRVLDLGCGRGASSRFLARVLCVSVVAADLWVSAAELEAGVRREGLEDRVEVRNLDVEWELPFAPESFDKVFVMDAVHYFGGEARFWERLLPLMKPGGRLCVGSPCFSAEFAPESLAALPPVYDDGTDLWPTEFSKYHSPGWWRDLLEGTGQLTVLECAELEDGERYWEDDVLDNLERGGSVETALADAAQIRFRGDGLPHLTHFVLCAEMRA